MMAIRGIRGGRRQRAKPFIPSERMKAFQMIQMIVAELSQPSQTSAKMIPVQGVHREVLRQVMSRIKTFRGEVSGVRKFSSEMSNSDGPCWNIYKHTRLFVSQLNM